MQTTGNLNLLTHKQQQALLKLAHFQKLAQFVAEKNMEEYWTENSELNKYLGARPDGSDALDYYEKFGMEKDPHRMIQGLLHLNNMHLLLRNYHLSQLQLGEDIILASREALEVLKQDN